jgi:hypothetical protein
MSKIITLTRKRIAIDTPIDSTDVATFIHIVATVDNAERILSTPAPKSFSDADRRARYDAATESAANGTALLNEWWNAAKKKYSTPAAARFDSGVPEFYELVDENGNAYTGRLKSAPTEEGVSFTYDISGIIGEVVTDGCDGTCCSCKN